MNRDLLLQDCLVFDPINEIDGEIMDICISEGQIVDKVAERVKKIDLSGKVVMPGGVDMHSHILGSKLGFGRTMCPEDHRGDPVRLTKETRSGVGGTMPSSFVTGYRYSSMGYTTVIEPALPSIKALSVWEEIRDLTNLNTGLLPMVSNSMVTFHYLSEGDTSGLAAYLSWLLQAVGGLGLKAVNPGGTYSWAHGKNIRRLDTEIPDWGVTPRQVIRGLCDAVESLGLPHTLHLHPNNLGKVGNIETTIETLDAVRDIKGSNGRKQVVHLAHMSFDSIGMTEDGQPLWSDVASGGLRLAEYMNKNEHFTTDLGQITFGPATTMTGDGPFQFSLYQMTKNKWGNIAVDVEMPGGAGVVPYYYDPKSPANSVQWTIPLEFALSIDDVWRCVMSTDHPNAGPFTKYPLVLSWLMSRRQRDIWMEKMHPFAESRSTLADIEREWSLYEVAISTRAAPAKILGLQTMKGHLSVGANADIAVYDFGSIDDLADDPERIINGFGESYLTVLGGQIVAKKGRVKTTPNGQTYSVNARVNDDLQARVFDEMKKLFGRWYSHSFANYPVPERYRDKEKDIVIDSTHIGG